MELSNLEKKMAADLEAKIFGRHKSVTFDFQERQENLLGLFEHLLPDELKWIPRTVKGIIIHEGSVLSVTTMISDIWWEVGNGQAVRFELHLDDYDMFLSMPPETLGYLMARYAPPTVVSQSEASSNGTV